MSRTSREIHYPAAAVPALDPFILLVHQGMIEDVFLEDLSSRGVSVTRSSPFVSAELPAAQNGSKNLFPDSTLVSTTCGNGSTIKSRFVVGCDGAHSKVRKSMPGVEMRGESGKAAWGVIDGVLKTDFPDLWSKTVINSKGKGSVLCIPRERGMTRLYIELAGAGDEEEGREMTQEFVMNKAREIMSPFSVEWEVVGKSSFLL